MTNVIPIRPAALADRSVFERASRHRFRDLRRQFGSQIAVASVLGVDPATLARWESGAVAAMPAWPIAALETLTRKAA